MVSLSLIRHPHPTMPTLTRFLKITGLTALTIYATMAALAYLVEPRTRPMSEPIDSKIIRDAGKPNA